MDEVRLGLIGGGPWAKRHVATLKLLKTKARVVAYMRRQQENLSWLPDAKRVIHQTDIFDRNLVDAVLVVCGPGAALNYVKMAYESGLPVLVEKPVTTELREALRLFRLAHGYGLSSEGDLPWIRVGYVHLHAPAYLLLRTKLSKHCHETGDRIKRVVSEGSGPGPIRSYSSLWDYGTHDAAMLFDLLEATGIYDCPPEVLSVERLRGDRGERWAFDVNVASVRVSISVSSASEAKVRSLLVETEKGRRFFYDDREVHGRKVLIDGFPFNEDERGALTVMLDSFVGEIAKRPVLKRPLNHMRDLRLTLQATELLAAVEKEQSD